jgi:hypothetical protein
METLNDPCRLLTFCVSGPSGIECFNVGLFAQILWEKNKLRFAIYGSKHTQTYHRSPTTYAICRHVPTPFRQSRHYWLWHRYVVQPEGQTVMRHNDRGSLATPRGFWIPEHRRLRNVKRFSALFLRPRSSDQLHAIVQYDQHCVAVEFGNDEAWNDKG